MPLKASGSTTTCPTISVLDAKFERLLRGALGQPTPRRQGRAQSATSVAQLPTNPLLPCFLKYLTRMSAVLGPRLGPIVEPRRGNVGVAELLLSLGDIYASCENAFVAAVRAASVTQRSFTLSADPAGVEFACAVVRHRGGGIGAMGRGARQVFSISRRCATAARERSPFGK
jgi:hypothetical protein